VEKCQIVTKEELVSKLKNQYEVFEKITIENNDSKALKPFFNDLLKIASMRKHIPNISHKPGLTPFYITKGEGQILYYSVIDPQGVTVIDEPIQLQEFQSEYGELRYEQFLAALENPDLNTALQPFFGDLLKIASKRGHVNVVTIDVVDKIRKNINCIHDKYEKAAGTEDKLGQRSQKSASNFFSKEAAMYGTWGSFKNSDLRRRNVQDIIDTTSQYLHHFKPKN